MVVNRVFISYQHKDSRFAHLMAEELQLRGIIPWVDKKPGGFAAGDESEATARRVIAEEVSGFVLVLTEHTWESDFIKRIEVPEAIYRKRRDPSFWLCVVSPDYRMSCVSAKMLEKWNIDLAKFHSYPRHRSTKETLPAFARRAALEVLRKHLDSTTHQVLESGIELSVNSYEPIAGEAHEILHIDAYHALGGHPYRTTTWKRFLTAAQDVKVELSRRFGRQTIVVNGSKHFTAAFIFGRVFSRYPLRIRQTPSEMWTTDGETVALDDRIAIDFRPGLPMERSLIVEIATGEKDIASGVKSLIDTGAIPHGDRLTVQPTSGRVEVSDVISRSLAQRIYSEMDKVVDGTTSQIHLFVAAPQALFMTLGTLFQTMPETHLYEWTGSSYAKTIIVPPRLR